MKEQINKFMWSLIARKCVCVCTCTRTRPVRGKEYLWRTKVARLNVKPHSLKKKNELIDRGL